MRKTCIVIGTSHAAVQLALSLRQEGWDGKIELIGQEECLPYRRPPLSKEYLAGEKSSNDIPIRPQAFYEKSDIDFRLGSRVEKINRDSKTVDLDNGESLSYDKLAICTGARARSLQIPGSTLNGVHYLRDISDSRAIKAQVTRGKNAVLIGGGYIGLETAAVLNKLGMKVTVLEVMDRILQRVTAREVSEFYDRIHSEEGVNVKTSANVHAIKGNGHVQSILCEDGTEYPADLVIIGVGVLPNVELAKSACLAVKNGILVDECARTSDPDIVAAGDCANHHNRFAGQRIRIESVSNAVDQARSAAASICDKETAYDSCPWFSSNQYDLRLQIAGLNLGYDEVLIRGDRNSSRSFVAWYLKDGRLISADCINRPKEFLVAKKLITEGIAINADQLIDDSLDPGGFIS